MLVSLKSVLVALPLGVLPALSWAFPPSLDIGAFAIDNYVSNGNGLPNLTYQIAAGQHVFSGANYSVPGYTAAHSSGTGGPNMALDRRDTQVTKAAITSTSSGYGNREYCDFLFYGGHGLPGGIYLGASPGYGGVSANELNLGSGYNRWFLANGCNLFNTASEPAAAWQPAFKGLKAMLSFRSVVFDNNMSWHLYTDFWLNWTWREKSLANAFFDSQTNYGYSHLYPSAGLEPGCLSAEVPAGRVDYCQEAFRGTDKNYAPAIANTGHYYSRVIGAPMY